MSRSSPRGHTAHTGEGETTSHSPQYSRRSQYRLEAPSDQSTHVASCSPAAILPSIPASGCVIPSRALGRVECLGCSRARHSRSVLRARGLPCDLTRMDWRSGLGHVPPNLWTDWRDARAHLPARFGWPTACTSWPGTRTRVGCSKRLLKLRHTLGLLAEEYHSTAGLQSGMFSHVARLNAVLNVTGHPKTSETPRTDNVVE
jgi:hypothetical protein